MGGNIVRLLRLRNNVYGTEQRRGAKHSSSRSFEHFYSLYVGHINWEIEGVVPCLRVTNINTIEQNCDLLIIAASDADIGLRANGTTLSNIHTGDVFQQIVNTLHWRTLNFFVVQYSYHSRRLTSRQRCA